MVTHPFLTDVVRRQIGEVFWEARGYRRACSWSEALDAYPNIKSKAARLDSRALGGVYTADMLQWIDNVTEDTDAVMKVLNKYPDHVLDLLVPSIPLKDRS